MQNATLPREPLDPGQESMDGQQHRCGVILPLQGELAGGAAEVGECVLQILDHGHRLAHGHLRAAKVLGLVVDRAPLAGLGVDREDPVVGVGDVDVEGVVALGNGEAGDGDVAVGVQLGGAVGARTPYRIGGVLADQAVFREDVAIAALHAGGTVGDGDGFAGDGGGFGGGRLLGGGLGAGVWAESAAATASRLVQARRRFMAMFLLWGAAHRWVGRRRRDDCRTEGPARESRVIKLL